MMTQQDDVTRGFGDLSVAGGTKHESAPGTTTDGPDGDRGLSTGAKIAAGAIGAAVVTAAIGYGIHKMHDASGKKKDEEKHAGQYAPVHQQPHGATGAPGYSQPPSYGAAGGPAGGLAQSYFDGRDQAQHVQYQHQPPQYHQQPHASSHTQAAHGQSSWTASATGAAVAGGAYGMSHHDSKHKDEHKKKDTKNKKDKKDKEDKEHKKGKKDKKDKKHKTHKRSGSRSGSDSDSSSSDSD